MIVFISFSTSTIGTFIFRYSSKLNLNVFFSSSNKLPFLFLFETDTDKFLFIFPSVIILPNLNLLLKVEDKSSNPYLQNEVPFKICFISLIKEVINL